jgi:hypothetical protein
MLSRCNLRALQHLSIATILCSLAAHQPALAAESVRRIEIYVQPYYEATRSPNTPPRVLVGRIFDDLLASMKKEDIIKARDMIETDPRVVTPMTMMVLAIRLYDMGLRDDAVFWFYAAKARYTTLEDVIDVRTSGLIAPSEAVKSFAVLAGPVINGYAFCDRAKQYATNMKAIAWAEAHPYSVLLMTQLTGREGDRAANLKKVDQRAKDIRRTGARAFRRSEVRRGIRRDPPQDRGRREVLLEVNAASAATIGRLHEFQNRRCFQP